jgi:hypothetical protein
MRPDSGTAAPLTASLVGRHCPILAAALKLHSNRNILRTSTIIFMTTIMVKVLNILQLLHRDSNKAEPVLQ